jgi:hypothetical protein
MMRVNIAPDWRQQPDDAAADNFAQDIAPPSFTAKAERNVALMRADSTRKNYQGGDQPSQHSLSRAARLQGNTTEHTASSAREPMGIRVVISSLRKPSLHPTTCHLVKKPRSGSYIIGGAIDSNVEVLGRYVRKFTKKCATPRIVTTSSKNPGRKRVVHVPAMEANVTQQNDESHAGIVYIMLELRQPSATERGNAAKAKNTFRAREHFRAND